MRYVTILLLVLGVLGPVVAVEQPALRPERPYPKVTLEGLEDLKLGAPLPSKSVFPGLVLKTYQEPDYDEAGRPISRTLVKFYHEGFYLGRGMIDANKRLVELEITDWRVTYDFRFAAASTWKHVQTQLSDVKLHYAYDLDALVAESPELPGLQVHFDTAAYGTQSRLTGDFTPLAVTGLPGAAKATKLRLFWIPIE